MIADERSERRRRIALWLILAVLTLVLVVLAGHFLEPSPPKKIVLAAGQVGGGYYTFGREYQKRLEKLGLGVEVAETNGSVDNLHRLVDGRADVAFVQGLVPAQALVANWIQSFKEFPPRQKPASFSIDQVMEKLMEGGGPTR